MLRHKLKASRPESRALAGRDIGASETFTSYSDGENSGLRRLRQPAALVALAIGNLSESDAVFCRATAWSPTITASGARRLSAIVSRACREVGL